MLCKEIDALNAECIRKEKLAQELKGRIEDYSKSIQVIIDQITTLQMIWSNKITIVGFVLLFSIILFTECLPQSKENQIIPGYSASFCVKIIKLVNSIETSDEIYEYLNEPKKRMLNGLRFQELLRLQKLKDSAKWLEDLGKRSSIYGINSLADDEYD
uniref:Uncharacterized protein n=1 Tax=Schistosoma haematobium TaxID=6185 RepID=A0A095A1M3_SCHHA